jgi:hypothetical protein
MSEEEPRTITRQRRVLNLRDWRRGALESDFATLVTEPTRVYDADAQAATLVYLALDEDFTDLVTVLRRLDIRRWTRTGGMQSLSRTFGSHPRNRLKNNFCGPASLVATMGRRIGRSVVRRWSWRLPMGRSIPRSPRDTSG